MSSLENIGNEIAFGTQVDVTAAPDGPCQLVTLQDLLNALAQNPSDQLAMLRSTTNKLSQFLGQPCSGIPIESLADHRDDFSHYLVGSKYAKNSVRSYNNYVRILLDEATKLGWIPSHPQLPDAWTGVTGIGSKPKHLGLLRFLVKRGLSPKDVGEDDLAEWIKLKVERGGSYRNSSVETAWLRRALVRSGVDHQLCCRKTRKPNHGIPLENFPPSLRQEVEELLHWKQHDRIVGRSSKAQIRPITAKKLSGTFSSLFGFAINVIGVTDCTTISGLVTKDITSRYVDWLLGERDVRGRSVEACLSPLSAALRQHPKYKTLDFAWFKELVDSLPEDDEEEAFSRKELKYLSYDVVAKIPGLIRAGRPNAAKQSKEALAIQVRDELLVSWLVALPWRQLNIRNCRIGGENPNLHKSKISPLRSIEKYPWVEKAEREDPEAVFWQFEFSRKETKTGNAIRCVLPLRLVALLEEYLHEHRGNLIQGKDPGTLFVNNAGRRLLPIQVTDLVKTLVLRHGGRPVTPHLFRDIFAYMWVGKFPGDVLTLSKLLWHRNLETTVNTYARKYNESSALCRMEALLG
jgi:integrase